MAVAKDNYTLLIEKLDSFIRKYYLNQIIRGVLYSVGLILALFLASTILEHYFYFGTGGRKLLFYSFVGSSLLALALWVVIPALRYFNLGKIISHEQAAQIIGLHFTNVKDKLLNILQLKQQADSNASGAALIRASINQKSEAIKPVPFRAAINLNNNRKYLKYALPPLLLLIIILFAAPSMIRDSTNRLINNNKMYEREAPFHFRIQQEDLTVVQYDDFSLDVEIEGDVLPDEVFIDIDNYQYRLTKEAANKFSYRFSNVQKDTEFKLFSSGVKSEDYELSVLKKPNILGFDVKLDYPAYTLRKDEKISNVGDLIVPMGTKIDWVFNSENTDNIAIRFNDLAELTPTNRFDDALFTFKKKALKDESYKIYVSNKYLPNADSVGYSISVVPDLHPSIRVEKFQDSVETKLLYFVGDASDDYGLRSLSFNYRIKKNNGAQGKLNTIKLEKPNNKEIQYTHTWDLELLELEPGDEVTYFFEVYDNDAVNGNKSARTNLMVFEKPTVEEYEEMAAKNNDDIKKDLERSLQESKKIQDDFKKLREKLLQEKDVDWQTKKEMEKLLERQKELEKQIEDAKQNFEENLKNQEEFTEPNEELAEKQEKLQEMFEELMSDEMKELMQQIEELMQKMEKDNALEMMEDMEMNDEKLEMELDRMLELFKQMEMDYEMEQQIDKLEELAKQQEELSQETETGEKEQEELKKEQEEINEKFEDIKEKMDELEKKNEELENKRDLGDSEEQMDDIQQELNESKEQLNQEQNKKASKSQKKASQKMQEMADQMAAQMEQGEMDQMQEDMASLRQLLENLVGLSFDQEDLIDLIAEANVNTPRYVELVQDQYKLKDDFQLVEDSLQALSKRIFQIETYVVEKVTEVKKNMKEGLEQLEERRKPQSAMHQQRVMKNVNDLALMLSEVMQQMQQQMSSMMQGSQMCSKPGGKGQSGKVPMDKISQGQQKLGEQMQQMRDAMQKGMQEGGTSKQFAEMAAKQAALRKALKELQKEKQQNGQGGSKQLQELLDQMNKTETDLVNKKLSNEMMKRQQEIMTRLLEAERAEREREYDNKRKSEVAEQKERKMPPSLEEYIKKREAEIEIYKSVSPALKPYYKMLVEEYFKSLKTSS
ncbi:MAG: DUF4175 domain-containing protein [Bacteroidota bacterium]